MCEPLIFFCSTFFPMNCSTTGILSVVIGSIFAGGANGPHWYSWSPPSRLVLQHLYQRSQHHVLIVIPTVSWWPICLSWSWDHFSSGTHIISLWLHQISQACLTCFGTCSNTVFMVAKKIRKVLRSHWMRALLLSAADASWSWFYSIKQIHLASRMNC